MGLRGPKPKSKELESAQGFPGRRKSQAKSAAKKSSQQQQKTRDSASVRAAKTSGAAVHDDDVRHIPTAPSWLKKAAKVIWAECWAAPDALVRLKSTDAGILARYCHVRSEYEAIARRSVPPTVRALKHAPKEGSLPEYVDRPNPLWEQMLSFARELRALEQLLGLTPVSRVALASRGLSKVPNPADNDGNDDKPDAPPSGGPLGLLKSSSRLN